MGLGRWSGPCREWSDPRVQGKEMWGATFFRWQKWLLLLCSLHKATEPRASSPDRASCPAWSMCCYFASTMSYCVERRKEGQEAEMTMSFKPSCVGEIVWHQQILAGKVLLTRSQRSNLGSQAC